MSDKCYVIYAIMTNKETKQVEGVSIISCVDMEEKVYKYLNHLTKEFNAEYANENTVCINDVRFPFWGFVTYGDAICDFKMEELK